MNSSSLSSSLSSSFFRFLILSLFALTLSGCFETKTEEKKPDLTIFGHNSFVGKGGLGPEIVSLFEKKCQCMLKMIPVGDAGQIISRLELDARRGKSEGQVAVGFDPYTFERAKAFADPWTNWTPARFDKIPSDLKLSSGFLPYDFGLMTFIADTTQIKGKKIVAPKHLTDLLHPEWKRSLLLEDPRTSTPGLLFLIYTHAVLGEKAWKFWDEMRFQWKTLAPGWSGAYQLFMKGEAPMVWSYFTSQAYHRAHGAGTRYEGLVFEDGHPIQIEGAVLIKNGFESQEQKLLAMSFLEFLISPEVQALVPRKNWMMPVIPDTQLPTDFQSLPQVKNRLQLVATQQQIQDLLAKWNRVVSGVK